MARYHFGFQTLVSDEFGDVLTGQAVTFWDSLSGGSQYTDLAADQAGTTPVSTVVSIASGQYDVWAPDGILSWYVQGSTPFRYLAFADGLADLVAGLLTSVATLTAFMDDQLSRPQFTRDPAEQAANHALVLIPTVS